MPGSSNIILKPELGQVFTPDNIVQQMVQLITNSGTILEPSCGDGAFLRQLPPTAIGLEIDPDVAPANAQIMDFFDWQTPVDVIIGNPPYLRYQDIPLTTQNKLPQVLDTRSNLYLFFIWRSIDLLKPKGELIFIVPRDFIKLTAALPLNKRLYEEGGFAYWQEFGDARIFQAASPNVAIFKWIKNAQHSIPIEYINGYLSFNQSKNSRVLISSLFDIRVGGASGLNEVFFNSAGNIDLVTSETKRTGNTTKAFYVDTPNDYLQAHKQELLNRKIKQFTEDNWWKWGRGINYIEGDKIYVNCKTRDMMPFYTHPSGWYDGSVLALIPKDNIINIDYYIKLLNQNNWEEQGFKVGGRLIFGQRSLLNAFLTVE